VEGEKGLDRDTKAALALSALEARGEKSGNDREREELERAKKASLSTGATSTAAAADGGGDGAGEKGGDKEVTLVVSPSRSRPAAAGGGGGGNGKGKGKRGGITVATDKVESEGAVINCIDSPPNTKAANSSSSSSSSSGVVALVEGGCSSGTIDVDSMDFTSLMDKPLNPWHAFAEPMTSLSLLPQPGSVPGEVVGKWYMSRGGVIPTIQPSPHSTTASSSSSSSHDPVSSSGSGSGSAVVVASRPPPTFKRVSARVWRGITQDAFPADSQPVSRR
jgi:hypothetical protein